MFFPLSDTVDTGLDAAVRQGALPRVPPPQHAEKRDPCPPPAHSRRARQSGRDRRTRAVTGFIMNRNTRQKAFSKRTLDAQRPSPMLKFLGLQGHPRSVVLPCLSVPPWPSSREGTTGTPSLGGRKRGCRAQSHVLPVVLHSWGGRPRAGCMGA